MWKQLQFDQYNQKYNDFLTKNIQKVKSLEDDLIKTWTN